MEIQATDVAGNVRTNTYAVGVSGSSKTFAFDPNGNMTGDGTRTFEWDAENRLIVVNHPANQRSEFAYNGHHQRVRIVEKDNGVVMIDKRLLWSDLNEIAEERASDGTTVIKRFFSQGLTEGAASFFYTRDHLNSVRNLTDSAGTLRARYDYDPYGPQTKLSGDKDADFAFTGHYRHVQSGLVLALYRAYNPETGRWTSEDPLRFRRMTLPLYPTAGGVLSALAVIDPGETNPFAYVSNRPLNYIDPLGLQACDDCPTQCWGNLKQDLLWLCLVTTNLSALASCAVACTPFALFGGLPWLGCFLKCVKIVVPVALTVCALRAGYKYYQCLQQC